MRNNTIVVHDSEYLMNKSYREGAMAFRHSVPWSCNPYRDGTSAYDGWDSGHVNESAGEHFRFGQDLVMAPLTGARFEMDDKVPRIQGGDVEPRWAQEQLDRARQLAKHLAAQAKALPAY